MFDKMKQLMEMKKQADVVKKQLESTTAECEDVRGIKIVIDGAQTVRSIKIDDQYYQSRKKEELERDLMRSVNAANKKVQSMAAQKLAAVMPGL